MKNIISIKLHILFVIVTVIHQKPLQSQISTPIDPLSSGSLLESESIPSFNVGEFNNEEIDSNFNNCDTIGCINTYYAFNIPVDIDLINSSQRFDLGNNRSILLYRIESNTAEGFQLVFSEFQLPKNATIYVHNKDFTDYLGAYTERNMRATGGFAVQPIYSNIITVEIDLMTSDIQNTNVRIKDIAYVFQKDRRDFGNSLDCHNNVICQPWANDWCDPIRSAVKLRLEKELSADDIRWFASSGALTNNTRFDFRNYILGAYHTIDGALDLNNAFVFFNFHSPECNPSINGNDRMSLLGVSEVASDKGWFCPDITLLELLDPIPIQYNVFYSGWNIKKQSDLPSDNVTSIHHPAADVKKISDGELLVENPLHARCWRVNWSSGYNERGSSGGGLWEEEQRLIGTLSFSYHEEDRCEDDADFYYGKLKSAWDDVGSHLSHNDAIVAISGIDPIRACQSNISITGNLWPASDWQLDNEIVIQASNQIILAPGAVPTSIVSSVPAHGLGNNSRYVFRAGNSIVINANFRVEANNSFAAVVQPCSPLIGCNQGAAKKGSSDERIEYLSNESLNGFLYPNPVSTDGLTYIDQIVNEINSNLKSYSVVNIIGQEQYVQITGNTLNLAHLESGTYFLTLKFENEAVYNFKILKQ